MKCYLCCEDPVTCFPAVFFISLFIERARSLWQVRGDIQKQKQQQQQQQQKTPFQYKCHCQLLTC